MPGSAFREGSVEGDDDSKVIVRSNGTVTTYVGKGIACSSLQEIRDC